MEEQTIDGYDEQVDAEAFLSEKMPLSRLLLPWFIAMFSLFMISWAWFSEIDIVSSTRGVIIPNTRLQFIQSNGSNVVNRILVKEGQHVSAGDSLVEFLQTDKLGDQAKIQDTLLKNRARFYRLKAMQGFYQHRRQKIAPPENNPFLEREISILDSQKSVFRFQDTTLKKKIETLQADLKSLGREIELLDLLVPRTMVDIERSKLLLDEGIIGREKLDTLYEKLIHQKKERQIKQARVEGIMAEIDYQEESHRLSRESQQQEIEVELLKLEQEFRILNQDLHKLESEIRLKNLISPITGIVNEIMVYTQGAVVQSGEVIMSIVPEKSPLEVEAKILNQDVGFIEEGHTVAVKLDSFNFTRYGKLNGTIRRIASGGVEDPQLGMIYPTIIELANQKIEVDDKVFSLKPGMTVTIDIKTGHRKIADYILEPFLRYSDEALRER
ncbi:HlyD family type I secretion periplasmic adaptor subunit [bacterium]|nr:HlyD family type I secretion periplasmic adaptor subunit [bacterium]